MTPTLLGRIQTRLAMLGTVGVVWTLLIGLVVPRPDGASSGDVYKALFTALLIVAIVGIVWELIYHGLQQYRWEKDWPTIFGLLVAVPEGIVAWLCLKNDIPWAVGEVQASTFLTMLQSAGYPDSSTTVQAWSPFSRVATASLPAAMISRRFTSLTAVARSGSNSPACGVS